MIRTSPSVCLPGETNTCDHPVEESTLFTSWNDPESGVESFILTARVAPIQQTFYFVNSGFSSDGRYCWFYCAYPPGGSSNYGRLLGVLDLKEARVSVFPETLFLDASPLVDPQTAEAYWCTGAEIWRRRPDENAPSHLVNRLPAGLVISRRPWRLATHLTFSADRRAVGFDAEIGRDWIIGHAPLDGGKIELWHRFDRCYNHAQCSPVDNDLMLAAQDLSIDPVTGEQLRCENRLWLVRRNGEAEPIYASADPTAYRGVSPSVGEGKTISQTNRDARALHGHEWWNTAGTHIWYVHYGLGVERVSLIDRRPELIWTHRTCSHAHCDAGERWLVADNQPPDEPDNSRVAFFNRASGREINMVSFMPKPAEFRSYHIHPHARFCCGDRYICYTTTVLGAVDVAFARVADLVAATGGISQEAKEV